MRHGTRAAGLLALALCAAPAAPAATKPYRIAGVQRDAEGKPRPAGFLKEVRKGAAFEIVYLDEAKRREAIRLALGRDVDLLPGRTDERHPGYLVFALEIANTADEDLMFNPGHARLASDKEDVSFALDYSALYEATRRLGPRAPSLEEMAGFIFDRGAVIKPGGSARKLMAFEAPREDRFREISVRLLEIAIGTESFDVVFPFRKFPVEGEGGKED